MKATGVLPKKTLKIWSKFSGYLKYSCNPNLSSRRKGEMTDPGFRRFGFNTTASGGNLSSLDLSILYKEAKMPYVPQGGWESVFPWQHTYTRMAPTPEPWAGLLGQRGACQLPQLNHCTWVQRLARQWTRGSPSQRGVLSMRGSRGPPRSTARALGATPLGDTSQPLPLFTLHSPLQLGSAQPAAPGSGSQTLPQAGPCYSRWSKQQAE